jgi:hypothetical protein
MHFKQCYEHHKKRVQRIGHTIDRNVPRLPLVWLALLLLPLLGAADPTVYIKTLTKASDSTGLFLSEGDGGFIVVSKVGEKSPAVMAGIGKGDLIDSIDGHDAKGLSLEGVISLIREAPEDLTIGITRGGDAFVVANRAAQAVILANTGVDGVSAVTAAADAAEAAAKAAKAARASAFDQITAAARAAGAAITQLSPSLVHSAHTQHGARALLAEKVAVAASDAAMSAGGLQEASVLSAASLAAAAAKSTSEAVRKCLQSVGARAKEVEELAAKLTKQVLRNSDAEYEVLESAEEKASVGGSDDEMEQPGEKDLEDREVLLTLLKERDSLDWGLSFAEDVGLVVLADMKKVCVLTADAHLLPTCWILYYHPSHLLDLILSSFPTCWILYYHPSHFAAHLSCYLSGYHVRTGRCSASFGDARGGCGVGHQ